MSPWIKLLRPKQWIKNGFVFAPLFFSGEFTHVESWHLAIQAALAFLCASCLVYIVNDIKDVAEDREHPKKQNRPIASGRIKPKQAALLAVAFALASWALLAPLPKACAVIGVAYVVLNGFYTFYLKRIAIIDVFFIASCYVLRVLMGCYALQVEVSSWIILTTFLLALFLGFGKRYHEVGLEEYVKHKPNLQHYSRSLLDRLVIICGGAALMAYAIYATEVANRIDRVEMSYTTAFVAFGLFRYLQAMYVYGKGGEPETIILSDKLQLANVAAWLFVTLWIMFY